MVSYDMSHLRQYPWPRVWYNFPIILCGIVLQLVWVAALLADPNVINVTEIHSLQPYLHPVYYREILIAVLSCTAGLAFWGFFIKRKLYALLALIPQQFVLCLSSGGGVHAIMMGQFADGVIRTPSFLLADQSPIIVFTFFHTWAMILILLHGEG